MNYDVIILGAGAAGLMCAATAEARGRRVLLVEHAESIGKKILISGGGRCNFTNVNARADRYLSKNPHFAKSSLGRYTPQDFIAAVDGFQIAWHEKTLGQLFCDGSARQIVDMLTCMAGSTTILTCVSVTEVSHADGVFRIIAGGKPYAAPALVVATGGPSIPKMGATGFAYDLARQFGLKIIEPRPALVPLTLGGEELMFRDLSGVATPTRVRCGKTVFEEASLFTHRGLSGPAILQISSYWRHGDSIGIDFLPGDDGAKMLLAAKRATPRASVKSALSQHLPDRLAEALAGRLNLGGNLADQPDRTLAAAGARLSDWSFTPNGTEGYAKAEVTIGGVDTDGLDQRTLAAKHLPGLHFIGEAVDVTGWLGGYNFQWAWASGVAAGESV